MTLTTTAGAADADSYADVATAEAYALKMGLAFTAVVAAQEAALRRGTAWVDARFRARFPGQRQNGRTQSLEWPRKGAYDPEGELIAIGEIPTEIVQATIEAAVRELASPNSLSPDVTLGGQKVLTQVGEIGWEVTRKPATTDDLKPTLTAVEGILAALIGAKSNAKFVKRA